MWALKKAKFWSKKRKRRSKGLGSGLSSCGHCHCCHNPCPNVCPHLNISAMASSASQCTSNFQPNAPPLPPGTEYVHDWTGSPPERHEPLIEGIGYENESGSSVSHGPMVYGPTTSYQQYMAPVPAYGVPVWPEMQAEWSTGLCHCEADMPTCLLGFFCPCILFGNVAEKLDNGMTSCLQASVVWYILQQTTSLGCIYSFGFRRKLRAKYNLPEKPLPDFLVHYLCWPCAFCQEYRELNVRRGREEAVASIPIMAPPQEQSMTY